MLDELQNRVAERSRRTDKSVVSLKVLIVPDKFKGTLTAPEAAAAIASGWKRIRPADTIELLPMSDGGDGFGEVMGGLLAAKCLSILTLDAAHRPSRAHWWWEPGSLTAMIESAEILGLAKHPDCHPNDLDSFGLAAVIRAACRKGARHCLIGIGGTATVDGGFGLARALGWKVIDDRNNPIKSWTRLDALANIRPPARALLLGKIIVAVDVANPLLGPHGCARVFGPQKGLTDFALSDRCLSRLAAVAAQHFGRDDSIAAGAGAAGGLGFGLRVFLHAQLEPGFELFARTARLNQRLREAGLVITGEGAIDRSTLMGKGVGEIARACRAAKVPCLGLAGVVTSSRTRGAFSITGALTDLTSAKRARKEPGYWLERLSMRLAREWRD